MESPRRRSWPPHLQHKVTEISEIRPDLPIWLCNWIMWHISRTIDNRPSDARESLNQFLMNENNPESGTPEVPASNVQPEEAVGPVNPATAPQPTQTKRPRLIIPEQEAAPSPACCSRRACSGPACSRSTDTSSFAISRSRARTNSA